jgi:isopenicillin N synthase-like dioxygenase
VTNHGISQEFMEEVFSQSKKFFELPLSEKMKVLRNEKHRGYTPVLDELLDPDNQIHGSFLFLFNSELLPFLFFYEFINIK